MGGKSTLPDWAEKALRQRLEHPDGNVAVTRNTEYRFHRKRLMVYMGARVRPLANVRNYDGAVIYNGEAIWPLLSLGAFFCGGCK